MEQERRWNSRTQITMDVAVYYSGLGLLQCKTRDISYDGAYIETGRIALTEDSDVELVFAGNNGGKHIAHRLTAQITRVTDDGAGLCFNNLEVSTYRFLQYLLTGHNQNRAVVY
ncbi:MAG: PilZ domain-containing protein [Gammaproteobacteria bacterium]|nr:PilZ domain-containing protein [Gammaproteobacteria bacterium]